jgi:hypothetical protein
MADNSGCAVKGVKCLRSNAEIMGSNPTKDMDICVCVCMLSCV